MNRAETAGLTPREPEMTFEEILVAMGVNLSYLASSDDGEDGDDENDRIEEGKMSEDDKPSWVMGAINNMVQQCMERLGHRQMKLDKLTQQGWEDAADSFRKRDETYSTSELQILAIDSPQTDDNAPAPPLTTNGVS